MMNGTCVVLVSYLLGKLTDYVVVLFFLLAAVVVGAAMMALQPCTDGSI